MVLETSIQPVFSQYVGTMFESMVKDLLIEFNREGLLPFRFDTIGGWWDKGEEIDLVALRNDDSVILFCECKWQDRVHAKKILAQLKRKSSTVPWKQKNRKEYFCVIARSFLPGTVPKEDPVIFLDADSLMDWHTRCSQN